MLPVSRPCVPSVTVRTHVSRLCHLQRHGFITTAQLTAQLLAVADLNAVLHVRAYWDPHVHQCCRVRLTSACDSPMKEKHSGRNSMRQPATTASCRAIE